MGNCYTEEKGLDGVVEGIDIENLEIIKNQSQKCLCKIKFDKNKSGTGFFCLIPFPKNTNLFQVLMTNNHVIGENDIINGKIIKFTINNDEKEINILLDNSRLVYTNKIYDITIIEIKKNEIDCIDFLGIDDQLYTENPIKYFKGRSIYIIQYPNGNKAQFAPGKIKNMSVDKYSIEHKCQTQPGSSGSPIIDLKTYRVIGIHKGSNNKNKNWNLGTFLKEPIEEFRKKFINKINDNNNDNDIIQINKEEYNKIKNKLKKLEQSDNVDNNNFNNNKNKDKNDINNKEINDNISYIINNNQKINNNEEKHLNQNNNKKIKNENNNLDIKNNKSNDNNNFNNKLNLNVKIEEKKENKNNN